MKRDECLARHFFTGYGDLIGEAFNIIELPDQAERKCQAVEVIAINGLGIRFAVEHTLLQPFEGQKQDDVVFLKVFLRLEKDPSLILPGFTIRVVLSVGAVPKGVNWETVGQIVHRWLRQSSRSIPIGMSKHIVGGLPFALEVQVIKTDCPGQPGKIFIARKWPDKPLENIIRKALGDKLPKLIDAKADRRIMLFEENIPFGEVVIIETIESVKGEFPNLRKIDSIWIADTVGWESDKAVFFYQIRPNMTARFTISPASLPTQLGEGQPETTEPPAPHYA